MMKGLTFSFLAKLLTARPYDGAKCHVGVTQNGGSSSYQEDQMGAFQGGGEGGSENNVW